ncbi:MAG: glycine zipper 2TM domain-containing protein [Kiloniellales bacterium]|nr:glycine zipper 2TM domain-containing protein [Kiloniellales bacterium]
MRMRTLVTLFSLLLLAAGCTERGLGTKQTVGGLTGAALGGLLGAQFGSGTGQLATTAAGVVLGGLIGSEIGRSLDDVDRMKMDEANRKAQNASVGETIVWNNPDSGNSGSVTPTRDGVSQSGQYCREFRQTINVGGRTEAGYGTACRQPDGSWRIVEG